MPRPSIGASLLLLAAACSSSDSPPAGPAAPRGTDESPIETFNSTPAPPAGQTSNEGTNGESLGNGPAPALDTGATGANAGAAAVDAGAASPLADASAPIPEASEGGAPSTTDPSVDENLAFILEDGFQATYFVSECRSLGEDGSIIEGVAGGTLPVGAGYILECRMENLPTRATTDVLSASDEPWCALGELLTYEASGDERLTVSAITPPDVSPAVLIATREGEQVNLTQAAAFGALIWPVWVEATYDVNEVTPAQQGRLCDEIFAL